MSKKAGLVLIGDWTSRRRDALWSQAFNPAGPAHPQGTTAEVLYEKNRGVWTRCAGGEEGYCEKNADAAGTEGRGKGNE